MESHEDLSKINRDELLRELEEHATDKKPATSAEKRNEFFDRQYNPDNPDYTKPEIEAVPQLEFVVTNDDLKESHEKMLSSYGPQLFTFEDFVWHGLGLDWESATENEKSFVTKIFDTLLAEGKFKKVGDKYKVVSKVTVQDEPKPTTSAEMPQPEVVTEVLPLPTESEPNVPRTQTESVEQVIPDAEEAEQKSVEEIAPAEVTSTEPDTEATRVIPLPPPEENPPASDVLPVIQTAEIPLAPEIPVTPVVSEASPVSIQPEAVFEVDNLKETQRRYAQAQVNYKNEYHKHFKWLKEVREGLGFGETTSDILTKVAPKGMEKFQEEMKDAYQAYKQAKNEKKKNIIVPATTPEEIKKFDPNLIMKEDDRVREIYKNRILMEAENEWDALQKKISELTPEKERGRVKKALESWSKKPLAVRLTALPIIMGLGVAALGPTVGLAGGITAGAAYTGVRLARSLGGYVGAKYVGQKTSESFENKNQAEKESIRKAYAEQAVNSNYEDEDFDSRLENLENKRKRQILYKAGAMVVAGAGAGILAGLAESTATNLVHSYAGGGSHYEVPSVGKEVVESGLKPKGFFGRIEDKIIDKIKGTKTLSQEQFSKAVSDKIAPPKLSAKADELFRQNAYDQNPELAEKLNLERPPVDLYDLPTKPHSDLIFGNNIPKNVSEAVNVAEVKLSSRGFIQTFMDMKEKLAKQYPDPNAADVPPGVKHFLTTPSTKLAQEYGFWDTKAGTSAMGLKGEALAVDAEGHLKLEHLAGKPTEIIDTSANKFDTLHADKMHVFKGPATHEVVTPKVAEPVEVSPENGNYLDGSYKPFNTDSVYAPKPAGQFDPSDFSRARFNAHDVVGKNPAEHLQNVTPKAPFEHIVKGEFGQPAVPGAKAAETLHGAVEFTHRSVVTGTDLHIKVAEIAGGQKNLMVGDTAIANELHLPDGSTRMQLFDNLQHGEKSAVFREAFVAAQEKMNLSLPKGASADYHLFFENRQGGVIDVVHGAPGNPNMVQVLLNGKEIAKGLATVKGPKLTLDPTLHHPHWFMADTVYETAFKHLLKEIKLKDNSYILKELTLPKVVNK
jgi:hypothetical protein